MPFVFYLSYTRLWVAKPWFHRTGSTLTHLTVQLPTTIMAGRRLDDLEWLLGTRVQLLQGWVEAPSSIPTFMKQNSALGRFVPYARYKLELGEFS